MSEWIFRVFNCPAEANAVSAWPTHLKNPPSVCIAFVLICFGTFTLPHTHTHKDTHITIAVVINASSSDFTCLCSFHVAIGCSRICRFVLIILAEGAPGPLWIKTKTIRYIYAWSWSIPSAAGSSRACGRCDQLKLVSQVLQKRTHTRKFEGISTQVSPCQCNDIISKGSKWIRMRNWARK